MPYEPAALLRFLIIVWTVLGPVCSTLAQPTAAASAEHQPTITIVRIDGDDLVIDAGAANLEHATRLTVYRSLEVRHPITHKLLRDRFALADVSVVQAGARLSIVHVIGSPSHPVSVGDSIELVSRQSSAPAPPGRNQVASNAPRNDTPDAGALEQPAANGGRPGPASAETRSGLRSAEAEERELLAYWYAGLAKDPAARAHLYQAFLQRHPASRLRSYVQTEIDYLLGTARRQLQPSAARSDQAALVRVRMLARSHADPGELVELAALVDPTPEFRSLLVHVRSLADPRAAQTLLADIDERGHARIRVPARFACAPGFAYFIETVDTQGRAALVVANAQAPQIVVVEAPQPRADASLAATRVHYTSELVSFDDLNGRDWFLLNEGDFLYRLRRPLLYGLRLGYGNYRGEGGTVDELDRLRLAPKPAGFSYGFLELQFELHRLFGLALRGTVGLGRPHDPNEERKGITGGFQVRARIGVADSTHLELAGELLPEIGQRAYIGLHWEAIPRLPMATEVVVTDQPVHSDELAVRLVYELGFRVSDRIAIALRPSYQLRTIRHAGPGLGLSTTFDW